MNSRVWLHLFWGFPQAYIFADLHSNDSTWWNQTHSSQLLNEPAYRLRGSVKQLAAAGDSLSACMYRTPPEATHSASSGSPLIHGFSSTDSFLHCTGGSRRKYGQWVGDLLQVTWKITFKTGKWITAWAELCAFLFHGSTDLLHSKKLKRVLIGHDAWRALLYFSRHLWGLRCLITGGSWHHAREGGEEGGWDLNKFHSWHLHQGFSPFYFHDHFGVALPLERKKKNWDGITETVSELTGRLAAPWIQNVWMSSVKSIRKAHKSKWKCKRRLERRSEYQSVV